MKNIQPSFETLPSETSPIALPKSAGVRSDIQLHVKAVYELVSALLDQVESLQNEPEDSDENPYLNLREEVRRFEIELIRRALTRSHGRQVQAAKLLGLNATTLNAKLKRYHLHWPYLIDSRPSQFHHPGAEA